LSLLIFGLGTNLGNREDNINLAIFLLSEKFGTALSKAKVYISEPLVKESAPDYFKTLPFLNSAIAFDSEIDPSHIIKVIKEIENKIGRQVTEKWAPRVIDIDILIYENHNLNLPEIQIPHLEILNRDFALLPLIDILKELKKPYEIYKKTLSKLPFKTAKINYF